MFVAPYGHTVIRSTIFEAQSAEQLEENFLMTESNHLLLRGIFIPHEEAEATSYLGLFQIPQLTALQV